MIVPLTLADFLERAELVYGDREAITDEPNPPGGGLGRITYREFADMSRSLAAALDDLGVGEGERVAIVSPNAARFLVSLFGVSVYGRILVPVNFRLNVDEVRYIIEHSGSTVALIDPELDEPLRQIPIKHRFVLGAATDARFFRRQGATPRGRVTDENATVSINYTSGTTARPKGVQLTHRGCWLNAVAKMKISFCLFDVSDSGKKSFIFIKSSVRDTHINSRKILINHAASSHVNMSHFGIANFVWRQTYRLARCDEGRVRIREEKRIDICWIG